MYHPQSASREARRRSPALPLPRSLSPRDQRRDPRRLVDRVSACVLLVRRPLRSEARRRRAEHGPGKCAENRGNNPSNWVAGEVLRCSVRARLMDRGLALRCLCGGGEEPGTCGCAAEGGHRVAARRAQLAAALIAGEALPFLLSGYANQFSTLRLAKPAKSSVLRVIKVKSFIFAIAAIWPSA